MDRIELGSSSNDRRSDAERIFGPTSSFPRQRAASMRSRPSIRIRRSSATSPPPNFNPNNPFLSVDELRSYSGGGNNADNRTSRNVSENPYAGSPAVSNNPFLQDEETKKNQQGFVQEEEQGWDSDQDLSWRGRRRSSSEPRRGRWSTPPPLITHSDLREGDTPYMPPLAEEITQRDFGPTRPQGEYLSPPPNTVGNGSFRRLRRASGAAMNKFHRNRATTVSGSSIGSPGHGHHPVECDPALVDVLDVIDPEVSTLSTLTNVQNSLFVPDLGRFVNRNPTYTLSRERESDDEESLPESPAHEGGNQSEEDKLRKHDSTYSQKRLLGDFSYSLEDPQFAVLPEGSHLEGWSKEDLIELNDHVRHMLHSKRSKFKRSMKGFVKYISKPLGFFIFIYATLITLFGLAWVLFLIGWIYVGERQLYIINVIDNVLVALFAIMGDGLAPFRAVDTYHMAFIAHYTLKTWKIRKSRALPELRNKNDIPWRREGDVVDLEPGVTPGEEEHEYSVLNPTQQKRLMHHQEKFSKSHTFYKPHETFTHYAFSLKLLMAIVILLDLHSCFQIALGACTWSIYYKVRPMALTTVILCCSICCNISGGVLISIGDRRSRKKDVIERLFRQQLTSEAMKKMEKRKKKEEKRNASLEIRRKDSNSFDIRRSLSLDLKRTLTSDVKQKTSLDIASTRSRT